MNAAIVLLALAVGCEPPLAPTDADGDGAPFTRDCDDGDARIHPGAAETCDGRDEDCDGLVDEGISVSAWYRDADGDGWGDPDSREYACSAPEGFVAAGGDCDDGDADVAPDAEDGDCDGVDQDCDGWDGRCRTLDPALAFWGAGPGDVASMSLAGVGDFDRDGFDDFLVGSPTYRHTTPGAGAAMLVRGGPAPAGGDLEARGLKLAGEAPRDVAGWASAGAGDVDGDGFADLLVGAPDAAGQDPGTGRVYLVRGTHAARAMDLADADALFLGSKADGGLGWSVAGGGDVDGDGRDDLLLGALRGPGFDLTAPAAWLLPGARALEGGTLDALGLRLAAVNPNLHSCTVVAMADDIDGDGFDDLLVGGPGPYSPAGQGPGRVFLLLGQAALADRALVDADACFRGTRSEWAGNAVAGVGDVDGDGHGDLLVGAYGHDEAAPAVGAAYLVLGASAPTDRDLVDADAIFLGVEAYACAGSAVAGPGDVNDDGFADLLIGAPGTNLTRGDFGHAALFLGAPIPAGGSLADADLLLGTGLADDGAGQTLAAAGDVDGDGVPDLLVGAPGADLNGADSGAAYLILGNTLW
jgi:hypothetical protein